MLGAFYVVLSGLAPVANFVTQGGAWRHGIGVPNVLNRHAYPGLFCAVPIRTEGSEALVFLRETGPYGDLIFFGASSIGGFGLITDNELCG